MTARQNKNDKYDKNVNGDNENNNGCRLYRYQNLCMWHYNPATDIFTTLVSIVDSDVFPSRKLPVCWLFKKK